jgi:hypothetical protein
MKYWSEICEVMHQDAIADFKAGAISEADMREYDELCLTPETSQDNNAKGNIAQETENMKHADLRQVSGTVAAKAAYGRSQTPPLNCIVRERTFGSLTLLFRSWWNLFPNPNPYAARDGAFLAVDAVVNGRIGNLYRAVFRAQGEGA